MGLSGVGRPEQYDLAGFGPEAARFQGADLLTDRGLGIEVEVARVLTASNPAARTCNWAPEALRADTSRFSTAVRES